jgi:threonine synthase
MPPRTAVTERWDMWRYAPVMPLKDGEAPVSLGEGLTPMHDLPKLARQVGVARLWVKDEGLNPTASFKARGMSAAVTRARGLNVPGLVVPTAGNAGAALTAYAAAAGIPVRVYAPMTTPKPILDTIVTLGADLQLVAISTSPLCESRIASRGRRRWASSSPSSLDGACPRTSSIRLAAARA